MSQFSSFLLLRRALIADAAASGATGLLLFAGAGLLERLLGLPSALLRGAGLLLVPYVVFVAWVGMRARIARGPVWAVIVANAAWAMASIGLILSGFLAPTALGMAFVIGQAMVVALLGDLQYVALKAVA